ncbi:MAG: hypothetical protein JWP63_5587, partial [Candidatus Solibacter sp.]|nr:hypothetical protein [Candidatus Solibacter sp.]
MVIWLLRAAGYRYRDAGMVTATALLLL